MTKVENIVLLNTTENQLTNEKGRLLGLDIVRAIAILLVVWFHSLPLLTPLTKLPVVGMLIKKTIVLSAWVGPLGVDLFFILSGFLIGSILIKAFLTKSSFSQKEILYFWLQRWFRTIPNYYFILTSCFLIYHYLYNTPFNWRYYLFLQNFARIHPPFFGEAWSLAVEEWFYLTLPICLFLTRFLLKDKEKRQILKISFVAYLSIFIILRFVKATIHDYSDFDSEIRKIVIFRLDSVMYGVLIAYHMHFNKIFLLKNSSKLLKIGISGVVLFTTIFFWGKEYSFFYMQNNIFRIFIDSSYFTVIPLLFSFIIPSACFMKELKFPIIKKILTQISLISYSMYLIHYSLIYIPFFKQLSPSSSIICIGYYCVYWLIVIVLSKIIHSYFERPIMSFRKHFTFGN